MRWLEICSLTHPFHAVSQARGTKGLVEQHRKVRTLAGQVRDAGTREVLVQLLPELLTTLEAHFAAEEAPEGLYEMIRTSAPERQNAIQDLAEEHRRLLETVRTLIAEGQGTGSDIVERAQRVCDAIGEHEAAENALVLDVFNTDIGGSG